MPNGIDFMTFLGVLEIEHWLTLVLLGAFAP